MAVTWQVDNTRSSIYLFDPRDILIKAELNGRHELPDISELVASIEEHGQIQPVVVRQEGSKGGKPVLVMGFSRWRAITQINKGRPAGERMKIAAVYSRCSEHDGFLMNWAENHHRNSTTPLDDAHYFHKMELWGMTQKEIAERLGVSLSTVKARLKLVGLEPEVKQAIKQGRVGASAAVQIGKLAAEEQREQVKGNGKVVVEHVNAKPSMRAVVDFIKRHQEESEVGAIKLFCQDLLEFIDGGH